MTTNIVLKLDSHPNPSFTKVLKQIWATLQTILILFLFAKEGIFIQQK